MDVETAILEQIDRDSDEIINFVQDLIRIPSFNPPGLYEEISSFIVDRLNQLGLEAELLSVPEEQVRQAGLVSPRFNLLAHLKGMGNHADQASLVLNTHMDTVPAGSGWNRDPFGAELHNGRIYGRGAVDSKGNIAAYTYTLVCIERAGVALDGQPILAFTADEEADSRFGVKYLLDNGLFRAKEALIEGFTYEIWNGFAGALQMKITASGKAVHVSRASQGVNAIEAMMRVIEELQDYGRQSRSKIARHDIDESLLLVGTIEGGEFPTIVPDRCTVQIFRTIYPEESISEVEMELRSVLSELTNSGIVLQVEQTFIAKPTRPVPESHSLIRSICESSQRVLGQKPAIVMLPSWADARFFDTAGIPVIGFGAGPRNRAEGNAHAADENIRIEDLLTGVRILALSLIRHLGIR